MDTGGPANCPSMMSTASTQNRRGVEFYAAEASKDELNSGVSITEHMRGSALDYAIIDASVGNIAKKPRFRKERSRSPYGDRGVEFLRLAREQTQLVMNDGNFRDRKAHVEGDVSLREWITRAGRVIDQVESLHVFRQVLEFVDLAHSQGVLLRNIRPSCFLLSKSHRVKFIDSAASRSGSSSESSERSTGRPTSAFPVLRQHDREETVENYLETSVREPSTSGERWVGMVGGVNFQLSKDAPERNRAGYVPEDCFNVDGFQKGRIELVDRNVSETSMQSAWLKDWAGNLGSPGAACGAHMVSGIGTDLDDTKTSRNDSLCDFSEDSSRSFENIFPLRQVLLIEQTLYTSPEELGGATSSVASDIYRLGVMFFELFCTFSSGSEWTRIMLNLRHRILPPRLLSELPKEAALCLRLLHPESSSRPKAREVLQCELLNEVEADLAERQATVDIEDKELELELLLDFLLRLQHQKQEAAHKLSKDIACLVADIGEIDTRRFSVKQRGVLRKSVKIEGSSAFKSVDREGSGVYNNVQLKSGRLMNNFKQLEHAYFAMRWKVDPPFSERGKVLSCIQENVTDARSANLSGLNTCKSDHKSFPVEEQGSHIEDRLGSFFNTLCKYARYSQFKVKASLRHGDLLNTANMVCSLSFDRDEEYFATAGVCKRIKVFECDAVLNENVDIHYPVVEMTSGSKLSSICWNSYIKNHIASSDYDGVVQLWDAHTSQNLMIYKEHDKRAWSVDFSHADPTQLASGSDDGCVKLWSINHEASICTLRMKANICCVQFPTDSAHLLAFGSADYRIYCYDLRHTRLPSCILENHNKAVSYVKFLDSTTLISASTDNTLKLWDISKPRKVGSVNNVCALTYTGHTNEKNFVGLSVADGYIACGSETNEVFVYHQSFPMSMASHKFGSANPTLGQKTEDESGQFVSSVCWRGKSQTLVAANSMGNIKLLEMV